MGMIIGERSFADRAANQARGQYDAAVGAAQRNAQRMGVNPNSGRYQGMMLNANLNKAAGMNAAYNNASFNWLGQAQDQFNKDRSFMFQNKQLDYDNALAWAKFNFDKKGYFDNIAARTAEAQQGIKSLSDNQEDRGFGYSGGLMGKTRLSGDNGSDQDWNELYNMIGTTGTPAQTATANSEYYKAYSPAAQMEQKMKIPGVQSLQDILNGSKTKTKPGLMWK